jgi:hypothetical protein
MCGRCAKATTALATERGLGYVYAALQIDGFSLGGVVVYTHLLSVPYCERCGRYLVHKASQRRFYGALDRFSHMVETVVRRMAQGDVVSAVAAHATIGARATGWEMCAVSRMEHEYCPDCGNNCLRFSAARKVSEDRWVDIKESPRTVFFEGDLELEP